MKEGCYGGRVSANIREFESTGVTTILNVNECHLNSTAEEIWNLMGEFRIYIDGFNEKFETEYDIKKAADKDYRLSNEEEKQNCIRIKLSFLKPTISKNS